MNESSTDPAVARFGAVTFDCADTTAMADFYRDALGLPVAHEADGFVALGRPGQPMLCFHRVEGHQPPTWPQAEVPKQAHLELGVDDLDAAHRRMLALGATEPPTQPQPDRWRVLLDPAGHPFCLTTYV
jgi:catechol 2,3-dioxygenase-like lactoylglutathione lyase family enzyme